MSVPTPDLLTLQAGEESPTAMDILPQSMVDPICKASYTQI
jgi:hypothetical protein